MNGKSFIGAAIQSSDQLDQINKHLHEPQCNRYMQLKNISR